MRQQPWKIPEEWPGEVVFIVGGGTSVAYQRVERLKGRKVIAINSSYEAVPFAQYLFFGDNRWHEDHRSRPAFGQFRANGGKVVTVSAPAGGGYLLKLNRVTPDRPDRGLTTTRTALSSQRTSFHGAINLAVMLGAKVIVLLGLDGTRGKSGLSHHHKPHKWATRPGDVTWIKQREQLQHIVAPLKARGIQVYNTSPISTVDYWPHCSLERFL